MIKYNSNTINDWNFGSSNVTKVYRNGTVRYIKLVPNYEIMPFTTVARTNGTINLTIGSGLTVSNYEYIKYSTDNGKTWTKVDNVDGEQVDISVSVNASDRVQWKGKGIRMATSTSAFTRFFGGTAQFDIEGNIMSLLNEDKYVGAEIENSATYTFHQLFNGCEQLINAENLILPNNVLENSFRSTFQVCRNLTTAPKLPATTLAINCYRVMFRNCSSLTTAPELLATTLVDNCYQQMFQSCTRLNSIKCLATDISANNCTYNWVKGVAASGTFVKAASMTSWTTGNDGIPSGWAVEGAPYDAEVEYLESNGTQWIDLGIPFTDDITFTIDKIRLQNTTVNTGFLGYRFVNTATAKGNMRYFLAFANGRIGARLGVNVDNTAAISKNKFYKIHFDGNSLYIDENLMINITQKYTTTNFGNIYLFACNTGNYYTADISKFYGAIGNTRIYKNNELIMDLIPVRKDGIGYMYDNVSGELFGNQGDGMFGIGADVE